MECKGRTVMKAIARARLTGGVVLSALAFGLAVTALGTAGSANASCVSVGRISTGPDCKSNVGNVAIELGKDAEATSLGTSNVTIAISNPSKSLFYNSDNQPTLAYAKGTSNVSVALSNDSLAGTLGIAQTHLRPWSGLQRLLLQRQPLRSPWRAADNTSLTIGDFSEAGAVGRHHKLAPPSATTSKCETTA